MKKLIAKITYPKITLVMALAFVLAAILVLLNSPRWLIAIPSIVFILGFGAVAVKGYYDSLAIKYTTNIEQYLSDSIDEREYVIRDLADKLNWATNEILGHKLKDDNAKINPINVAQNYNEFAVNCINQYPIKSKAPDIKS